MKKILFVCLFVVYIYNLNNKKYDLYQAEYFDLFDTYITISAYTKNEEEFEYFSNFIYEEMLKMHQLFSIYENYDFQNIKTINDNAGIQKIQVNRQLIDLIDFGIKMHKKTDGDLNIAMGPVLKLWNKSKQNNILPTKLELEQAYDFCDINDVIINYQDNTVFLKKQGMSLDVGAIAKGYTVEYVAQKASQMGLSSAIIDAGGNVRTIGKAKNKFWNVAIQSPFQSYDENFLDVISVENMSVISSGGYYRNHKIDNKIYHHIIDPKTLMPTQNFASVTVIGKHSDIVDALSTILFIKSIEDGKKILKLYDCEAIWVLENSDIIFSEGYAFYSKKY